VSFNRINRKTGNRLKQQNIDAETEEVVSRDEMVRGYEVAKGQYMIVEDQEIEAVQIESTRTIDIDETWGTEFREQMPEAIKAKIDEIMAKTERDPDGKTRERILERLKRIRDLLRPSRYRRDPNGNLRAIGKAIGGSSSTGDGQKATGSSGAGGHRGGRSSDDYLADLVESGGSW
jgi:hypothetical protein